MWCTWLPPARRSRHSSAFPNAKQKTANWTPAALVDFDGHVAMRVAMPSMTRHGELHRQKVRHANDFTPRPRPERAGSAPTP